MRRPCDLTLCILLLIAPDVTLAQNSETGKGCPYEILGICDPFVPGIIVSPDGKVGDVWLYVFNENETYGPQN